MKKSSIIYILLILTGIIFFTANAGLCVDEIAQHVPAVAEEIPAKTPNDIQLTISKFIVTIMGVLLSSIVIWGGLTIYNRFFVLNNPNRPMPDDDILNTPKTVEEAVLFFIKRNRLR